MGRDSFPLNHVAQKPVQHGHEHLQGGGIHSFSGQPCPNTSLTHSKNVILIFNLNLLSFNLKPQPLLWSLQALVKSLSHLTHKPPWWGPPGDFSRLSNPSLFSISSQDRCSGPRMRHRKWHPNPSCLLVRHLEGVSFPSHGCQNSRDTHTKTDDTWYIEESKQALGRQRYTPEHQTTGLLLFSYLRNFNSMTFLSTTCYLLIS